MANTAQFYGEVAGLVSLVAFIVYAWNALSGTQSPNRSSWLVWSALGLALAMISFEAGARDTLWVMGVQVLGPLIVALITIRHGEGGWDTLDKICLAGAGVGIAILLLFHSLLLVALAATLGVEITGAIPTVRKVLQRPGSENSLAWGLSFLANAINLFAIGNWSWGTATYPLYLFALTGIMTLLSLRKWVRP